MAAVELQPEDYPKYTHEDSKTWEGRWELIRGIPYAMSPAPSFRHQQINTKLARVFDEAFDNCEKCKVSIFVDFVLDESTVLQPDLVVVCGDEVLDVLKYAPSIAVEILSPSTAKRDKGVKYKLYENEGVKYYIIVDPESSEVFIYELKGEVYYLAAKGEGIHFEFEVDQCKASVDFSAIWP
ncbi:MAG: Uma2 family endonuclease [Bacteroidia bacterium]